MTELNEIIELLPEESFVDLMDQKIGNIEKRANGDQTVLNQLPTLGEYSKQVAFIDSKGKDLVNFIKNNGEIRINDAELNRLKKVINEYQGLINVLQLFNEEAPGINEIFRSSEYNRFVSNFRNYTNENGGKTSRINLLETKIEGVLNGLRLLKIDSEKNLDKDGILEKIKSVDFNRLETAQALANNLIHKREENQETEISKHYKYFEEKSDEYKTILRWSYKVFPIGKIWWLLLSIIAAFCTIVYIILSTKGASNLSIGDAIIRVSVITVGFYFVIFFSKQFERYVKLQNFYDNKTVSLKVMLGLSKISTLEEKNMIYEKALDKIFSEPNFDSNSSGKEGDVVHLVKEVFPTKIQTSIKD